MNFVSDGATPSRDHVGPVGANTPDAHVWVLLALGNPPPHLWVIFLVPVYVGTVGSWILCPIWFVSPRSRRFASFTHNSIARLDASPPPNLHRYSLRVVRPPILTPTCDSRIARRHRIGRSDYKASSRPPPRMDISRPRLVRIPHPTLFIGRRPSPRSSPTFFIGRRLPSSSYHTPASFPMRYPLPSFPRFPADRVP